MMISEKILEGFRQKYSVHPLIFQRSVEKAKTPGELFDILEDFPTEYPIVWSEEDRRWISTKDLVQKHSFDLSM